MALRCDDCRRVFQKKRTGCPYCGGRLYQDDTPVRSLLKQGYDLEAEGGKFQSPAAGDDFMEDLKRSYFEEHSGQGSVPPVKPEIPRVPLAEKAELSAPEVPGYPPVSQPEPPVVTPVNSGDDYFAGLSGSGSGTAPIPTVLQSQPGGEISAPQPDPYEAQLREIERQRKDLERQYRRMEMRNRFSGENLGRIFRWILIGLVIYLLASGAIIDLVASMLPSILALVILWFLLRSFLDSTR